MSDSKKYSGTKATLAVLISLAVTLTICELGLRAAAALGVMPQLFAQLGQANPPLDRRDGPGMYYAHPYTAYALKPGYTRGDIERINSLGFRGAEVSQQKPDDVYRVIAIGGSTTFGVYLPWQQTYPYFLEQDLRARLGTDKVEVLNAGMTGSTTAESVHRMITQLIPAEPDMVVIYHGFNDLFPRMFDDYADDYYHFRKSDPNNPPGLTRFILYRLALRVLSPAAFHENADLLSIVWKQKNLPTSDTDRTANFFAANNSAFETNLDIMVTSLRARGIEVVLATFAMHPDIWHWNSQLPAYTWEVGIPENNASIARVAETRNVPLVPFAEDVGMQRKYYFDSIHMTCEGNLVKADSFANIIAPIAAEKLGIESVPDTADLKVLDFCPPEEPKPWETGG